MIKIQSLIQKQVRYAAFNPPDYLSWYRIGFRGCFQSGGNHVPSNLCPAEGQLGSNTVLTTHIGVLSYSIIIDLISMMKLPPATDALLQRTQQNSQSHYGGPVSCCRGKQE